MKNPIHDKKKFHTNCEDGSVSVQLDFFVTASRFKNSYLLPVKIMLEVVEVQLEWKYTPKNYFEEPIHIIDERFELSISDGVAFAKIEPLFYSQHPEINEYLTRLIETRLQAVQLISHRDFILNKPSRSELRNDGTKNTFLEVEPIVMKVSIKPVDLMVRDKDGNIVSDSKKERLDKQRWFSETVAKYRSIDSTLDQMLKSYQMAVKDPKNELVHLYEIRDALSARFGKKKNAMKQLYITNKEWDIIGDLANSQPLEEGRHRGKAVGKLRSAENHELDIARKSASNMVEKYLIFLEGR